MCFLVNLKISALPNSKKFDSRPYVCINILHNMNTWNAYMFLFIFWDNDIEPFLLRSVWLWNDREYAGVTTQLKMLQRIEFTKVFNYFHRDIIDRPNVFVFDVVFFFILLQIIMSCYAFKGSAKKKKFNVYIRGLANQKEFYLQIKDLESSRDIIFLCSNKLLVFVLFLCVLLVIVRI